MLWRKRVFAFDELGRVGVLIDIKFLILTDSVIGDDLFFSGSLVLSLFSY